MIDYEAYYRGTDSPRAARSRQLNAAIKADHIFDLCHRAPPAQSVLEVGCGDGAVLAELHRRGLADRLDGVEISHTATALARQRPEINTVLTFDGRHLPFDDRAYDLVYATHVLEHVEDPRGFLAEMCRVAAATVIVEVPLEANLAALRATARGRSAAVGHIQQFSRSSIRRLIADAGLTIVAELSDPLPRAVRVFQDGPLLGTVKWAVRSALARVPGGERCMTVHYAALARV